MAIRWPICPQVLDDVRSYGGPVEADPIFAHVAAASPQQSELIH
jgi:hypothetical protein